MRNPNTTCHKCGRGCYVSPSRQESQKSWFCSDECRGIGKKSLCLICGKSTSRPRNVFCSRACSNKSRTGSVYDGTSVKSKAARLTRNRIRLTKAYGYQCSTPGCPVGGIWLGKPIVLQVDHIDGDSQNDDIENLRFLCANCHTQTETFGGRNIGRKPPHVS